MPIFPAEVPFALFRRFCFLMLVELYTAINKPDEVKKWRAERAKYPPPVAPMPREVKR